MSELVALARELVNIPSASGEEAEAARFVAAHLAELGYAVEVFEAAPGRPNVLATTDRPPRVVLSTHLDTVPPHLRAANAHPRARECRWLIDGEPTDNKLAAGSKGSLRLSLRTEGVTAHSAYPEQGRSAIDPLLDVLADVRRTPWPTDPFFGDTTLNIGVIAGGSRPNVVAGDARADLQIRLVTDAAPVRQLLERTVDGRARIEYLTAVNPVRLTTVPGFETCLVRFTTDIPHLANWGSPLLIGPGSILDAHTAHERISLEELAAGADMYVRLVRALLCGNGAA